MKIQKIKINRKKEVLNFLKKISNRMQLPFYQGAFKKIKIADNDWNWHYSY